MVDSVAILLPVSTPTLSAISPISSATSSDSAISSVAVDGGAAVTAAAKHRAEAIRLIEFLVGNESQRWYAEANAEYPVRPDVEPSALLASWGEFRADPLNVTELGRLNAEAVMAMDRAHWR